MTSIQPRHVLITFLYVPSIVFYVTIYAIVLQPRCSQSPITAAEQITSSHQGDVHTQNVPQYEGLICGSG